MLLLLYGIISLESTIILSLVFKTPMRRLVIISLDKIKRGRGPIIAKSVAGTVFAVLASSLNNAKRVHSRAVHDGDVNPIDQVLLSIHLLEASLMGFFLFLALLTDRLHHYMRELRLRRKSTMDAVRKNDGKFGGVEEILAREEQVGTFKDIVRQLESELDDKSEELVNKEAKIDAFKKQSEGLLVEYDRLISNNQQFRARLQSLDKELPLTPDKSHS